MPEADAAQPLPSKYSVDTTDLTSPPRNERERFLRDLQEHFRKQSKAGKPFCFRCAKLDYEKAQEEAAKKQRVKEPLWETVRIDFPLDEYGEKQRFTFLKDRPVVKPIGTGAGKHYVEVTYREFYCRQRGCKLSLELPTPKVEK